MNNADLLKLWDNEYSKISYHRRMGFKLEKEGKLKDALNEYELSIRIGHYSRFDMLHAYRFSYDRAIDICHQLGQYNKEKQILASLSKMLILKPEAKYYINRLNSLNHEQKKSIY